MIPLEMALSPVKGLLQTFEILMALSLAHLLKDAKKILNKRGLTCGNNSGEIDQNPILKNVCNYILFAGGGGGSNKQLITFPFYIPQTQMIVNNC